MKPWKKGSQKTSWSILKVNNLALTYHTELMAEMEKAAVGGYAEAKLADKRVEVFLHFALYAVVKFDFTRVGRIGKGGKRIRHGSSGTRDGTCDLSRVPAADQPKGPPLPQNIIIRYYDLSTTRKAWRSFYRRNFQSINAVLNDETGRFTTDFNAVINTGQVPPPSFSLSKSQKRKLYKLIKRKHGHR